MKLTGREHTNAIQSETHSHMIYNNNKKSDSLSLSAGIACMNSILNDQIARPKRLTSHCRVIGSGFRTELSLSLHQTPSIEYFSGIRVYRYSDDQRIYLVSVNILCLPPTYLLRSFPAHTGRFAMYIL